MRRIGLFVAAVGLCFGGCADEGGSGAADTGSVPGDAIVVDAEVTGGDTGGADAAPDTAPDTATTDAGDVAGLDVADAAPEADADAALPDDTGSPTDTGVDTGTTDVGPDDVTEPPLELAGPCPLSSRVGTFEIAEWDFYASITGEVAEGVIPLTVLQPAGEEGLCRLLQKVNPFCDPPCGPGQLCEHDGTCIPYPATKTVGTVTVSGLKVPVIMEPNGVGSYTETDVPFPLFDGGETITVEASGGDLAGFTMHGVGVELLSLPDTVLVMKKGEPLLVSWAPPAVETPANVLIAINVDQHGNSPVTLRCEVPDTGSYAVAGSLVKGLLEFGVSGFATMDVYRRTVDSEVLEPGCVETIVHSFAPGKLQVDGHVPCFSDKDCPDGETCNVGINTCVAP